MSAAMQSSALPPPVTSDLPHQPTQEGAAIQSGSSSSSSAPAPGVWQSYVAMGPNVGIPGVPQRVTRPADVVPPPPRIVDDPAPFVRRYYNAGSYPPQPEQDHAQQQQQQIPAQQQAHRSQMPAPATPIKMAGMPGRPRNKPPIMDPPGSKLASAPAGFPSPTMDHAAANPKFDDDVARLTYAMSQSLSEAVRRAVRENWEKCVVGSESHVAFLLNAALQHATNLTLKRAIRDFGTKIVKSSMVDIVEHLSQADIDLVGEMILAKASHNFLDRALDKRLRTIEAKPLINALCRAERLGYEPEDADEDDSSQPQPAAHAVSTAPANYVPPAASQPQQQPRPPASQQSTGIASCTLCYRQFMAQSAYEYHTSKAVCTRVPPAPGGFNYCCRYCGQGFTTPIGLQYHFNNKICGDFGQTGAAVHPITASPQTQTPARSSPVATPQARYVPSTATPTTLGRTVGGTDPYAHLTQEQRDSLNEELRQAEIQFAERFKAADAIADHNERRTRLDGLRNSFGTKQSIIRKKYGVKLRERRTRAEIEAERIRMGITAEMDGRGLSPSAKPTTPASTPHQNGAPPVGKGNTFSSINIPVKRELPDEGAEPIVGAGPKRPRIEGDEACVNWVSPNNTQMSALSSPAQNQAGAPIELSPSAGTASGGESAAASHSSGTPDLQAQASSAAAAMDTVNGQMRTANGETRSYESDGNEDRDEGDEDDDDNDDIPATLPAAVRQSLVSTRLGS